jgi:hypothetical protein
MTTARRLIAVLMVIATIVGVAYLQRSRPVQSAEAEFSRLGRASMPFVPNGDFVTSAWFCAGVPVGGPQQGGVAVVANPGEVALTGKITTFTDAAGVAAVAAPFEVPARGTASFDLAQMQPGNLRLGDGGDLRWRRIRRAARRQRIRQRCRRVQLDLIDVVLRRWLHGRGQQGQLVVTNPFPSDAIVSLAESTSTETRKPAILQSLLVKANSVLVISQDLLAKRTGLGHHGHEHSWPPWSVGHRSTSPAGRAGFAMTLGAPSLGDQFYFQEKSAPTWRRAIQHLQRVETEAVVNVVLGLDRARFVNPEPITVEPGKVASLIADDVGVPAGRHGAVFSTETEGSILVERAITRITEDTVWTTVVMGAPPCSSGR